MASYLNGMRAYLVDQEQIIEVKDGTKVQLESGQWFAVVGRFNVLLAQATGLTVGPFGTSLHISNLQTPDQPNSNFEVVEKPQLAFISTELNSLRYHQLWWPFAKLALGAEFTLTSIQAHVVKSWGWSIVIFSLLFKLILQPVTSMTARFQLNVSRIRSDLAPQLLHIKQNYDGEEAHNRLMAAHKELGVSPFYALKPMLGTFIQIPILIAVFNALGEMPQLDMQPFFWIENLAYPDAISSLPVAIPALGGTLNVLPIVMTAVTVFSTITFANSHACEAELKRQKRNLYLMAAAFFVLFYPFPAAMVLFWTINNLVHMVQQLISSHWREN